MYEASLTQMMKPPSPKQLKNEEALITYAIFLCGLLSLVVGFHWLQAYCNKASSTLDDTQHFGHKIFHSVIRRLRVRLGWEWSGRPSCSLLLLLSTYLIGNTLLCCTHLASYQTNHWASRFGWMGAANMALCVFFGMKNTPLAPTASLSHIQLNSIHQIVGYLTVFLVTLHAVFYTVHFARKGRWEALIEEGNVEGIGAGFAMMILLAGILRHRNYELFYLSHIIGFAATVILTGLHRPDWAKKLPIVMLFIACIWLLDRVIRATRMVYNMLNNQAILYPLPGGGTRIMLKKPCIKSALPGSHGFLWVPQIHLFQSHPFTIVSNDSSGLELVMKSREGFTKAAHKFATEHLLETAWVSLDGPYGSLPDGESYESIIFMAGGSGAAFTFGFMNRILKLSKSQSVEFVWAVRCTDHLSWFHHHLKGIVNARPRVNVTIYITDEEPRARRYDALHAITGSETGADGVERLPLLGKHMPNYEAILETDEGQGLLNDSSYEPNKFNANIRFEKMEAKKAVHEAIGRAQSHQRILLAACGPKPLMEAVRDSAEHRRWNEPGLRLDIHCEDFDS